ncbi:MAG: PDZ domain-containing protein [Niastella sp.]|nr:PDZ domain-containing protein [Niastella sp.]
MKLNSSHTYQGGGDLERQRNKSNVGYLGINWQADGEYYRVGKIIRAGIWDAEVHSPLIFQGINIPEGNYILAVNGIPIKLDKNLMPHLQCWLIKPLRLRIIRNLIFKMQNSNCKYAKQ